MASKVDRSDPALRRAVYSHYRGILGKYNDKANTIVGSLPRERVCEDKGVADRLESMIRQSNELQNNSTNANIATGNGGPPPPPPPCVGNIPAVRIASEIGPKKTYEPPAAIQNAMMTKDKKPFTYTPGGLNLNEIRSPRMARRISKNAHIEDSCSPQVLAPTSPHGPLPPAAQAALQPQIAVPVFPTGAPPPPPPLPGQGPPLSSQVPPPPAPGAAPVSRPPQQQQDFYPSPARPEFLADIASHPPLRPVGQPPRSSFEPSSQAPLQVQLKAVSPRPSPDLSAAPAEPQFINSSPIPEPLAAPQQVKPPLTPPTVQAQVRSAPPTPPPLQQQRAPPTPPVQSQPMRAPPTPPVQPQQQQGASWGNRTPPTPPPSLNKSPAPWMTSKTAQKESPPPWAVRAPSGDSPQPTPPIPQSTPQEHLTRVIPIQIEGREPLGKSSPGTVPQYSQPSPPPPQQQYRYVQPPPNFPGYAPPTPPQYQQVVPPQWPQAQTQQQPQWPQPQTQQQPQWPQAQTQQQPQWPQPQPQQQPQFQQSAPQLQEQTGRTRIIPIQIEGVNNIQQAPVFQSQNSYPGNFPPKSQNGDAVDGKKFQTQTSYTGNPIQSRSFRVLQKITGSDDDPQPSEPVSSENNGWGTNTSPLYPNYWYNPPQTPEEQQQFWEHYNAMCNYMAHMNATAMRYSPYPYPAYPSPYPYPPYPSDTEDYSNSSCDEMTFYGNVFKKHAEQKQQSAENNSPTQELGSVDDKYGESEEDTDTEIDEVQANALKSIRSVPDIHIYANSEDSSSEESDSSDEEEPESDNTSLPHQLSVIFEESELSSCEEGKRTNDKSESASSSASTINENAVKVRLPLQLKFTRLENDEEVATLIVGNSEMESSKSDGVKPVEDGSLIITDIVKDDSDPDVTATIVLRKTKKNENKNELDKAEKNADSPVDFWKELTDGESSRLASQELRNSEDESHWEDDSSSTSVQTVKKGNSGSDSMSEQETSRKNNEINNKSSLFDSNKVENVSEEDTSSKSSSEEEDEDTNEEEEPRKNEKMINKLIENLKEANKEKFEEEEEEEEDEDEESESSESSSSSDEESAHSNVFNDSNPKVVQNKEKHRVLESSKSFEESEEDDSGVTSDLSRHISETDTDPECGSELSKMTRCQRAATHSRLFKLLQEECDQEDEEEKCAESESLTSRKERLTLPLSNLNTGEDSLSSSSGVNSPSSPIVNDRLVKELVQSLLSKKKGRHFRKLPIEKLHAAALRILQEDMDPYDTVSTSDESNVFLSPAAIPVKRNITTPIDSAILNPEAYGVNYYDYCNYYSTWGAVNHDIEPDYDIVPSKTFKILQGQADRFSPQTVRGVPVRCPRVLSSKIPREQLTTPVPPGSSPSPKES